MTRPADGKQSCFAALHGSIKSLRSQIRAFRQIDSKSEWLFLFCLLRMHFQKSLKWYWDFASSIAVVISDQLLALTLGSARPNDAMRWAFFHRGGFRASLQYGF